MRQECLDHVLMLQERQLQRLLNAYVVYFNLVDIRAKNCRTPTREKGKNYVDLVQA